VGELLVARHGETEWSRLGKHTGRTDVELTERGVEQARRLGVVLHGRPLIAAFSSPLQRARRTAELACIAVELDPDLLEWDYGEYEGRTSREIRAERPGWWLWRDGVPQGETADQVGARADRVLDRVRPLLDDGDVLLVAHGHLLRVVIARWLALAPEQGYLFMLATATLSALTTEHDRPVLRLLNAGAPE
jgi:probable phosphoglycerate mutase